MTHPTIWQLRLCYQLAALRHRSQRNIPWFWDLPLCALELLAMAHGVFVLYLFAPAIASLFGFSLPTAFAFQRLGFCVLGVTVRPLQLLFSPLGRQPEKEEAERETQALKAQIRRHPWPLRIKNDFA